MQVTVENVSDLERRFNITVPVEDIDQEFKNRLQKFSAKAKVPGFRPGKVPPAILEKRYGNSVRGEVIDFLIRKTYTDAIEQEKLHPVNLPNIEVVSANPNEPLNFLATFEIYPEINLTDFGAIEVEKYISEITDHDVDEMLAKLQKENMIWTEINDPNRTAQIGDQLIVDFTVKVYSDKPPEPKTEKDVKFVLGDGTMWADFEKPLYGARAGGKINFTVKFPLTHVDKELVGRTADFEVNVHKVSSPTLPPLDDKLAAKIGVKEGGIDALKKEVRENMQRDLDHTLKMFLRNGVLYELLQSNRVKVPQALIDQELTQMEQRWRQQFASFPKDKKDEATFPKEKFVKQAEEQVSLGLILAHIIKEQDIKVEPEELRDKVADMASIYADSDRIIKWYYSDKKRLHEVESSLLEEKTINFVASKVKLVNKPISYTDALAKRDGKK